MNAVGVDFRELPIAPSTFRAKIARRADPSKAPPRVRRAVDGAPSELLYDRMKTAVIGEDANGLFPSRSCPRSAHDWAEQRAGAPLMLRCWGWRSAGRKTAIADVAQVGGEQAPVRVVVGGDVLPAAERVRWAEARPGQAAEGARAGEQPRRLLDMAQARADAVGPCSPLRRRAAATFYAKTGPANALAF